MYHQNLLKLPFSFLTSFQMDRLKNLFICSLSHDPWAAPDSSPTSPVEEQYGVDIHTFIDFISLKTLSIYLESR